MRSPYHRSPSSTGPSPIDAHRHCGRYCRQREFARAIHEYNTTTRACPFPSDANQWQPEAMRPPRDGNARARAKAALHPRDNSSKARSKDALCPRDGSAKARSKAARKPLYVRATAAPRPLEGRFASSSGRQAATVRLPRGPAPPARAAVAPAAAPAAHRRRGSSLPA